MEERINAWIAKYSAEVISAQNEDGAWRYCAENGPMTNAFFIILLRALGHPDEQMITALVQHLLASQNHLGYWSLYPDEAEALNVSATLEAYYALLISGQINVDSARWRAAQTVLAKDSVASHLHLSTRMLFSCIGQLPWPNYRLPATIVLAPTWSPLHFYQFAGYARAHLAPILLAATSNTHVILRHFPDLQTIVPSIHAHFARHNPGFAHRLRFFRATILKRLKTYLQSHLEQNGTLYSYASTTLFMVFALVAFGYSSTHPLIKQAISGIASFAYPLNGMQTHIQNADATVWNTALLSTALQAAGYPDRHRMISRATTYLLSKQHQNYSDWVRTNPFVRPGGWGFSDINTLVPDVDDTGATLRALAYNKPIQIETNGPLARARTQGTDWLLSMQNGDGGWPAFERNINYRFPTALKIDGVRGILTDPSSPDLTGRTLEYLGQFCQMTIREPNIKRGVQWLFKHQEVNGSWRGRWGICYIYGTWAAITGLCAVGVPHGHTALQRGISWLLSTQQADGGFGESCQSDVIGHYCPLAHSTLVQTAWALDTLVSNFDKPTQAMMKAVDFILQPLHHTGSFVNYPTGSGLPGSFYIHYHSYQYIWPLLAVGHFKRKYGRHSEP